MRIKKKLLLWLLVFIIVTAAAITYLNQVILPTKIKKLIIVNLSEATQKEVSIESLQFFITKGLVVKNLTISDNGKALVKIPHLNCSVLVWPFFKKQLFIPSMTVEGGEFYLERFSDGRINFAELFPQNKSSENKEAFSFTLSKVNLKNSLFFFKDDFVHQASSLEFNIPQASASFSLLRGLKFSLKAEKKGIGPLTTIKLQGEYNFSKEEFQGRLEVDNLTPSDFAAYYQAQGVTLGQGKIDILGLLNYKNNLLKSNLKAKITNLEVRKDSLNTYIIADSNFIIKYNLKEKSFDYSGDLYLIDSRISGLEFVNDISQVKGLVRFTKNSLEAKDISANCLDQKWEVQLKVEDFTAFNLKGEAVSRLPLEELQQILVKKFSLAAPFRAKGSTVLTVDFSVPEKDAQPDIKGNILVSDSILKFDVPDLEFSKLTGEIAFDLNSLSWRGVAFSYLGAIYKSNGILNNFKQPDIKFDLSSNEISLNSAVQIRDKSANFTKFIGNYMNSEYSVTGTLDFSRQRNILANLKGIVSANLVDLRKSSLLKKYEEGLKKVKPEGNIQAEFSFEGDLASPAKGKVTANLLSSEISLYGLHAKNFLLDYEQLDGMINIPMLHLSLYEGSLDLEGKLNLIPSNPVYYANINIQGVLLERLKLDTSASEKDISGILRSQIKLNGFLKDPDKLSGAGQIYISDGKLWELNLFKGLGSILFTKDFNNIVFNEGFCGFVIKDKSIYTDNLKLKSNLADLSGKVAIGFDHSLDATMDVQVLDDAPLSGTFRDVSTAILGQARRFGVIKITGTIDDPKPTFKASVLDILNGVKNTFMNSN